MAQEIERKFLVEDDSYKLLAYASCELKQGYLNTDPDATVRVRLAGERAFITVKNRNVGAVRSEWEYAIPASDARAMFEACGFKGIISKIRWLVDAGDGLTWEVDEFHGRHEGLVLAEIELPSADAPFTRAAFIGREVTGDAAYYNSTLAQL